MDEGIPWAVIGVVIAIVLFLICREIVCWYWKVNRIVSLLEDIKGALGRSGRASITETKSSDQNAKTLVVDD